MLDIHIASRAEMVRYLGREPTGDCLALIGYANGVAIGLGGLAYDDDGDCWLWSSLRPEARMFPRQLHRAALDVIAAAKAAGFNRILAHASLLIPKSGVWLMRLGFRFIENQGDRRLFAWERG